MRHDRSARLLRAAAAVAVAVAGSAMRAASECGCAAPQAGSVSGPSVPSPAGDPRALKILVRRDGPVVVTGAQLAGAGWDLDVVDPARVSLSLGGRPVAVEISDLVAFGLVPTSRLMFHGRAMRSRFTRDNVYWLVDSGGGPRAASRTIAPDASEPATRWYTATLRLERDTEYYPSMRSDEGEDRWMWGRPLAPGASRIESFQIAPPAVPGPESTLTVRLYGCSSDGATAPDHHLRIALNDVPIADVRFDGVGSQALRWPMRSDRLLAGVNRLEILSVGDTGARIDQVALDWFQLEYRAELAALDDYVAFAPTPLGRAFVVGGFRTADIVLLDMSDDLRPVRLEGGRIRAGSRGDYELLFAPEADSAARYVLYASGALRPPARIVPNAPSNWRNASHGADYLAITHGDFAGALAPLLAERADQGLRTEMVLVEDVYDEFSHGVFDPHAVRDFLQFAYEHWRPPAVSYVLLVGESSLDYLGHYGSEASNYVPSMQVASEWSGDLRAVTSDLWFANLEGTDDSPPEVLIGRFPVSSAAEAATIVAKTLAYETSAGAGWRTRALVIVDDDPSIALQELSARVLAAMAPVRALSLFDAGRYPWERDLPADISRAIDDGVGSVTFLGHGNVDMWGPWAGGGRIFQNGDIARLTNVDRPPILVSGACMNGWFDHPLKPTAMAELWLTHPGGGGVAAWSPSGLAGVENLSGLLEDFQRALIEPATAVSGGSSHAGVAALGAAVDHAVRAAHSRGPGPAGTARMFVLLGDPALVIAGSRSGAAASPAASPDAPIGGGAASRRSNWMPVALSGRP